VASRFLVPSKKELLFAKRLPHSEVRCAVTLVQPQNPAYESAAKRLTGMSLDGGWKVVSIFEPPPNATGGNFSYGYEVESENGKHAFLKALDYSRALQSPDPAKALNAMTSAYIFERDLLDRCRDRGLSRVVTAIASGKVVVPGDPMGGVVEYLIFEKADGDVRCQIENGDRFDLRLKLMSLHHVAVGMNQLHSQSIAHQDVKPSNVLMYQDESKVADLGCASCQGLNPPHETYQVAGDPAYAPPELLYGFVSPEWSIRRMGCDAYLLGSMVVWFFTGLGTTALLGSQMNPLHLPSQWTGTYQEVLPFIQNAFGRVLSIFRQHVPDPLADDLARIVGQLCEPDPHLRGHPRNRASRHVNNFALERYVTEFDLMAKRTIFAARAKT